MCEAG